MTVVQKNELFYMCSGSKELPTVVLLHGFLGSTKIWDSLLPYFSESYHVVCIDLPGHGKSSCFFEINTMAFCAKEVIEILAKENIANAHFIGHSMGGYVALEILNQIPSIVNSISLLNSTAFEDTEQKKIDRLLAVKVFDRNPKVFIEAAIENLFYSESLEKYPKEVKRMQVIALETSVEGAKASLRGMRERTDFVLMIRKTEVPVQLIAGIYDNTVRYDTIQEQAKESNIKVVTLNSGHMAFIESFEECKDALLTFISKHK